MLEMQIFKLDNSSLFHSMFRQHSVQCTCNVFENSPVQCSHSPRGCAPDRVSVNADLWGHKQLWEAEVILGVGAGLILFFGVFRAESKKPLVTSFSVGFCHLADIQNSFSCFS